MPLLEIQNLSVEFPTSSGVLRAVDGVSLTLDEGEILGVVGESGSGKSVTMLALMGLVAYPGRVRADRLAFARRDLLDISDGERRPLTGQDVAMIFQEPTTSLNPCFTIEFQLTETLRLHEGTTARRRAIELLDQVGIPAPEGRLKAYPHQLSGGMNQRVMIAMAIACNPKLLIADEPTTALDVTIQAQILDLCSRCSASAAWPSCSSPTTWGSSPRRRSASWSCMRARSWRSATPPRCSTPRSTPTRRRSWRHCPSVASATIGWRPFRASCLAC